MASTKKIITVVVVVMVIGIGIAVAVYIFRCQLFKLKSCVKDPNKTEPPTPIPPGTPPANLGKWIPETPPYNLGMYGPKIMALQTALGFTEKAVDGKLGPQTRSAIVTKGYVFPLTELDYNKIMLTTTTYYKEKCSLTLPGYNKNGFLDKNCGATTGACDPFACNPDKPGYNMCGDYGFPCN